MTNRFGLPLQDSPIPATSGPGLPAVTVDDLAFMSGNDQETRVCVGRFEALDGAGEDFVFFRGDTTPENGITVIASAYGRWKRKNREPTIDLLKAGCLGDGTGDQAPRIMAAIAAAQDLAIEADPTGTRRSIKLIVPSGQRFRLGSTVTFPGGNAWSVDIVGTSQPKQFNSNPFNDASWTASDPMTGGASFLVAPGVTGFLNPASGCRVSFQDVAIIGLSGVGTRIGVQDGGGAAVTDFQRCILANLSFGWTQPLQVTSPPQTNDTLFISNQVGAKLSATDMSLRNCKFFANGTGLESGVTNLSLDGATDFEANGTGWRVISWDNNYLHNGWFEANSVTNMTTDYPAVAAGYMHINQARWSGSPGQLRIREGGWFFGQNQRFGPNISFEGGNTIFDSSSLHPSSVWTGGGLQCRAVSQNTFVPVTLIGAGPNTEATANFLVTYRKAHIFMQDAPLLVHAPLNLPYGEPLDITIQQGTVMGAVTFDGMTDAGYSSTGIGLAKSTVLRIERTYPFGITYRTLIPWV